MAKQKRPKYSASIDTADDRQLREWQVRLGTLKNHGRYRLSFEPEGNSRTSPQNRYYFGCVVSALEEYARLQGDVLGKDEAHETLKRECGLWHEIINFDTGVVLKTLKSWTEYSVEEGAEYIDRCVAWLGQMGVVVMEPDTYRMEASR